MKRSGALAGLAAGAALMVAGCGGTTVVHPIGRPTPPSLQVGGGVAVRANEPGGGAGGYLADVALSSTPPGPAAAWRLRSGAASEAEVRRLAATLGLDSAPKHQDGQWLVGGPAGELAVGDGPGTPWSFDAGGHACLPDATCVTTGVVTNGPAPVPPGDDAMRRLAAPVLAAVGLGQAPLTVGDGRAQADPVVGGLQTSGFATVISSHGSETGVGSASGWLGQATRWLSYPRVSEREGFARLLALPRPMFACAVQPGQPNPCAPQHVTGVRPGLMLERDAGVPLLVPAWLFELAGGGPPVAVLAVADRYLARPTPPASSPVP